MNPGCDIAIFQNNTSSAFVFPFKVSQLNHFKGQ